MRLFVYQSITLFVFGFNVIGFTVRDDTRIFQSGPSDPHVRSNWGPKHFYEKEGLANYCHTVN